MSKLRRATLAVELCQLVVEALAQIGLTEQDVLSGAIEHTDLPWQVPPLIVEAPLFGSPLTEYIDRPTFVNVEALVNLFSDALLDMRNSPRKVLTSGGYKSTSAALPHLRASERNLYFSIPDGFPHGISEYAGVTLALECAHILQSNARVSEFVSDDDNYYAVLPDGMEVGVREGVPTIWADQWDLPVTSMVQELLRQPRGAIWEGCDYNVIAKVRSVCHTYSSRLREFEAVDWAIQTLRVIEGERELLRAVKSIKKVAFDRSARMALLRDAVEIANRMSITDRQRIEALKRMLVPEILTNSQFSKQLYSYYAVVPPVVAPRVIMRIREGVEHLLEQEEMLYARVLPNSRGVS